VQKKEPTHKEVKGVGWIRCDDITQISGQNSLKIIIKSVHFIIADNSVGFLRVVYSMYSVHERSILIVKTAFSSSIYIVKLLCKEMYTPTEGQYLKNIVHI
jgi:hypothetical protein